MPHSVLLLLMSALCWSWVYPILSLFVTVPIRHLHHLLQPLTSQCSTSLEQKNFPTQTLSPLYQRGGKERTRLIHLKNKNPSRGCCCWLTCEGDEMCTPGVSGCGQGGRLTLLAYRSDKVSIWWWSLILKQLHSKISGFKLPQQCKWWPGRLIGGYLNLVILLIFCLKH